MLPSIDETILTPAIGTSPRTLIIEGNAVLGATLQRDLHHAGYRADLAGDARTAMACLQSNFAPVVIIDLDLEGTRGLDLCREIRARKSPGYVYIIVRSHRTGDEAMIEGYEAGADDYLGKDRSTALLVARLKAAHRMISHEQGLKQLLSERRKMSLTDPLTSAFNRRYVLKYGQRALLKARELGQPTSLLAIDLDHFKSINDRFGHDVGDCVLVEFVRRTSSLLKDGEWCARVGGEEFIVFLPRSDPPRAKRVAERLRKTVAAEPFVSGRLIIPVTVSVGAASPLEEMGIEQLMRRADKALYRSKREGRNKSTVLSRRG